MQARATFGQRNGGVDRRQFISAPAGTPVRLDTHQPPRADASVDDIASFIGPNIHKYAGVLRKMADRNDGYGSFVIGWSWAAFFFNFLWMLYRKMWVWAAGYLVVSTVCSYVLGAAGGAAGFALCALAGLYGKSLYIQHAAGKIRDIQSTPRSSLELRSEMSRAGGTSSTIMFVILGMAAMVLLAVVMAAAKKNGV